MPMTSEDIKRLCEKATGKTYEELNELTKEALARLKPLGKYRIIACGGRLLFSDYKERDVCSLRLIELLRRYRFEHPDRSTPEISCLIVAQPGEPDVKVADYFLYPDGSIVRCDEATMKRLTIDQPGETRRHWQDRAIDHECDRLERVKPDEDTD
jgi:hypothetical protein